jgi:hypothetical protein
MRTHEPDATVLNPQIWDKDVFAVESPALSAAWLGRAANMSKYVR